MGGEGNDPVVVKKSGLTPVIAVAGSLAIYFLSQVIATVIVLAYPETKGWNQARAQSWLENSTLAQFILIGLVEFLTIFMVLQAMRLRHSAVRLIGLVKPRLKDILWALAGFAVYLPAYVSIFMLANALIPTLDTDQKQQLGFESAAGPVQLGLVFVSLVILPPLAEEILVRGFLFTGLRSKLKFWGAALITSAVFAAAHLQFGSGAPLLWTAAMDTFVLSVVLCYLREKTDSLWPGILLHALKNGIAFTVLFAGR